jgi:hypothetical protein
MSTLYVIGWHARENRPGGYVVDLWTDSSSQKSQVFSESDPEAVAQAVATRSKLKEIRPGYLNGTPMPTAEQCDAAGFELRDAHEYDPAVDLLHLARQELDDDGLGWVGGKAILTTIDERGISQRVLHHWTEDAVGAPIRPKPIDWTAWRAARVPAVPEGMSRLRREILGRKTRKAGR